MILVSIPIFKLSLSPELHLAFDYRLAPYITMQLPEKLASTVKSNVVEIKKWPLYE